MNLLILPGGSSPYVEEYKPVYTLLRDEAEKRGYKEIQVAHYPGQADETGKITGKGTLPGAVEAASKLIKQFADKGPFRIIARSFSCNVSLLAIKKTGVTNLKDIVLWGPAPFWLVWEQFKKDYRKLYDVYLSTGTDISEDYFDSEVPFEYLLKDYYDVPIIISTGAADKDYCPPCFFKYLEQICVDKKNIHFVDPVKESTHIMRPGDPGVKGYLNTLFRDYIN